MEKPYSFHAQDAESVADSDPQTAPVRKHEDVALQVVKSHAETALSLKDEVHCRRKVDFILMPLMLITFSLQYIDKVILNGASQFGIVQDLHLYRVVGIDPTTHKPILDLKRYSNVTLIFYWGALAGMLPAVFLAQKLPIGRYIGCTVVIWGVVTMLTVTCTGYHGFLAQRFFLGVTESAAGPGFSLIIAMWWRKSEQPLRYSIWYTSTGLGGFLGSMLIFGIGHIHGSLHPWKYQYLILGALTTCWGILMIFLLPNNPTTAWFLSREERMTAVERMRHEQTGIENKEFKFYQIKEMILDPKTWIMFITTFCLHNVNGAISGFGTIIISGFGYSPLKSILLTGAVGALVLVSLIIVGIVSNFVKNIRTILLSFCEIPVIIGAALVWKASWVTDRGAAIGGFIIMGFFAAAYMMMLSLSAANTAGHTKKAFTSGLLWGAWCISNGVAPLWVKTPEAVRHYPSLFKGVLSTSAIACVGGIVLRVYLQYVNKKRDRLYGKPTEDQVQAQSFADLTDGENTSFRYSL